MILDAWQLLARRMAYRRWRQGRWVQLADGRWLRTMQRYGLRYDACEWYTDI